MAVTGLPEKRADHAIAMSRFASDCRSKFQTLSKELETTLGPDTGDLNIRVGKCSEPDFSIAIADCMFTHSDPFLCLRYPQRACDGGR